MNMYIIIVIYFGAGFHMQQYSQKKTPLPPRPRSPQRGKISRGSELIPGNAAVPLTPMLTGPQEEWCISDGMKISDGRCFMIFPKSLVERAAFRRFMWYYDYLYIWLYLALEPSQLKNMLINFESFVSSRGENKKWFHAFTFCLDWLSQRSTVWNQKCLKPPPSLLPCVSNES